MTDKKRLGDCGEEYTVRYLEEQGFHIVERNWHSRYGEIDIIAVNEQYLLLVEVKTRRAGSMIPGEQAVTLQKQQRLVLTAQCYLQRYPTELQPRFDVAAVTAEGDRIIGFAYYESAF